MFKRRKSSMNGHNGLYVYGRSVKAIIEDNTKDNSFKAGQLIEKQSEKDSPIHLIFVDPQKTWYCVTLVTLTSVAKTDP